MRFSLCCTANARQICRLSHLRGFYFGREPVAIDGRQSSVCKNRSSKQYRLGADLLHDSLFGYQTIAFPALPSVELRKSSPVEQHDLSLRRPIEPQYFFISEESPVPARF
jgi:hypothetical protein